MCIREGMEDSVGLNDTEHVTFEDADLNLKGKDRDREKNDYMECKERAICGLRAARSENNCALLQRGFGFGRTLVRDGR
jgi:hypothetical protein